VGGARAPGARAATPPRRYRLALALWRLLARAALPFVLAYFRRRARGDPDYARWRDERLGRGPVLPGAIVVHAVSLGEMRSAVPLVRALLDRGLPVVTTHMTPAGRRAAHAAFGPEIAAGRMLARWLPIDHGPSWRRFLAACRPRAVIALEIEIWPIMIAECARAGVPVLLANSQIPGRSFPRARRLRQVLGAHPAGQVAAVLAKSDRHAARFRELGAARVEAAGELRFDQPVPPAQLAAAAALRAALGRPAIAVASVVEGEEEGYLAAYAAIRAGLHARGAPPPLILHIPRAPERFGANAARLAAAGLTVARRSELLGPDLAPRPGARAALAAADVLLGDSLGEMYFYLALADLAVVGGGFVPKGAHNVIEPLALGRPVLVGPHVWTIEYPGEEAAAAGVLTICPTVEVLAARVLELLADPARLAAAAEGARAFVAEHAGATPRILSALERLGVLA
jgi:3-deoxy-D-manno-octulosonic-acid transferase